MIKEFKVRKNIKLALNKLRLERAILKLLKKVMKVHKNL